MRPYGVGDHSFCKCKHCKPEREELTRVREARLAMEPERENITMIDARRLEMDDDEPKCVRCGRYWDDHGEAGGCARVA